MVKSKKPFLFEIQADSDWYQMEGLTGVVREKLLEALIQRILWYWAWQSWIVSWNYLKRLFKAKCPGLDNRLWANVSTYQRITIMLS